MTDMQRFDRLSIRRFRGLAGLELKDIGPFNVLLGANDVGKTSVLESIFLLSGSAAPGLAMRVQNFRNFLVRDHNDLSSLFHGLDLREPIEFTTFSGDVCRRLKISEEWDETTIDTQTVPPDGDATAVSLSRGKAPQSDQFSMSFPSRFRTLQFETNVESDGKIIWSCTVRAKVQNGEMRSAALTEDAEAYMIPSVFLQPGNPYEAGLIANTIVDKKSDRLIEYLQAVNSRITDVAVSGNIAYLDVGLNSMLPLNMFGGGMVRAMSILSSCIAGGQRIMLIDEIEDGLHHSAVASLLRTLFALSRKEGIQFFVTTHSVEFLGNLRRVLLEEAFADYREDVNCYALQRNKAGRVRAYRYAYDQFDHCIAQGLEIR